MGSFKPWEEFPSIWKTQAAFMAWVRGGVRRGLWEKHPVKLEFLKSNTFEMKNTNPRSMKRFPYVKGVKCAVCEELFKQSECQVDHINGNHSLRNMDDLREFIESMIMVRQEDLQIVCTPCHKIKSYAEKEGISFEKAKAIKQAIEICKSKKESQWLKERGITPASNATKRRKQVEDKLLEGI